MLIIGMAVFLVVLGAVFGTAILVYIGSRSEQPVDPFPGLILGTGIALAVWLAMTIAALVGGDRILLSAAGAREVQKSDAPQLINVVEEMTIASGLPKPPRVFLIEDDRPNAFAVGRKPENACVAVTSGLLRRLNRDELQGVVAHEIGHIRNLDVLFMTLAAVMVAAIAFLSQIFLRVMWQGGGRRGSSRRAEKGGGGGGNALALVLVIVGFLLAILAPIVANLLYLACSRRREYLADASAARFTRYPEGLASALEKIALPLSRAAPGFKAGEFTGEKPSRALAPLYIVNPLQAMSAVGLFSTHPATEERIRILRGMGGAGYVDYEAAFRKVAGTSCIGARTLKAEGSVPAREAAPVTDQKQQTVQQGREALDVLNRMAGFSIVPCACGMRIKVPPAYAKPTIGCPRCGRVNPIPAASARLAAIEKGLSAEC
jgi:heat shock protein HtpX